MHSCSKCRRKIQEMQWLIKHDTIFWQIMLQQIKLGLCINRNCILGFLSIISCSLPRTYVTIKSITLNKKKTKVLYLGKHVKRLYYMSIQYLNQNLIPNWIFLSPKTQFSSLSASWICFEFRFIPADKLNTNS